MAIENLTTEHADYTANSAHWTFLRNSYEGTGGYRDGAYIETYAKEASAKLTDRKSISHYYNYCQPIIDTYIGHLFKMPPTRQTTIEELTEFYTDTARGGNIGINELMREAGTLAHIYGHCFIVVDKPNVETETRLQDIESGNKPYAYTLTPESVIDWGVDSNGELMWIKIKERIDLNAETPLGDREFVDQYRIWDKEKWELYGKKSIDGEDEFIASGDHTLGVVPVVIVYNRKGVISPLPGIAEISDIAKINKRLFNLHSELDELLRSQTFSIITYQTDNPKDLADVELGADRILTYGVGAAMPQYIAPAATAMLAYERRIDGTIKEIYRLAKLNYTGGVAPSGIALAFEFEKTNQSLKDKAENLADAERKIADIVTKWETKESDLVIAYPKDFNLNDMEREMRVVLDALTINISETFDKEYKKKVYRDIMPQLKDETKEVIDKEIDTKEDLPDIEDAISGE